jgi:hypothetical protein
MAVTVKNSVFWDVTLRGSFKNRPSGGTSGLHHRGKKIRALGTTLTVSSNSVVSTSLIILP